MAACRYKAKPYENVKHEIWLGHANTDLSFVTEREYIPIVSHRIGSSLTIFPCAVDFEQPRALWLKVFNDTDRDHLVHNVVVHLKNAKSKEVRKRTRTS